MIKFSLIIIVIIILLQIIIIGFLFGKINSMKIMIVDFLDSISHSTNGQLKGPLVINQKNILIKTVNNMKKFIGWSIFSVVIAIIALTSIIVYNSFDYFEKYFEVKRDKLVLTTDVAVDSLQLVIEKQIHFNDSIKMEMEFVIKAFNDKQVALTEEKKSVNNLQNVIKHQNNMIENMKKELELKK